MPQTERRYSLLPAIGLVNDQRQMAKRPQPVGGLAGRAVGDAGFAQMTVGGGESPLDIDGRKGCKGVEEPGPDRARRAALADIFVGNSGQPRVIARPLRHPALARTGLVFLTAGLPRHPTLRFQSTFSAGAASSSRASKEIQLCVPRAAGRSCPGCGRGPETAPAAAPPPRRN